MGSTELILSHSTFSSPFLDSLSFSFIGLLITVISLYLKISQIKKIGSCENSSSLEDIEGGREYSIEHYTQNI